MKIIIETNSKEIADLVLQLQNQPTCEKFVPEDSNGKHHKTGTKDAN